MRVRREQLRFMAFFLMAASMFLFVIVKFGGPLWIQWLVDQQQFDFLNRLLGVGQAVNQSAGFYLGYAESHFYGPISQIAAALVFIIYSVLFLREASFRRYMVTVFIFLMITKMEVLFFPPYGDAIGGPFAEAIWLKRHHFNYAQLMLQPDYAQGGPRVYLFSLYPTYVALVMAFIRQPMLMLMALHTVVFLMIASTASMLREICRKVFSSDIAVLTSALFLFFPLVQAQTESLNMEPPTLFFITLSAFFLIQKKIAPSALAAIGAVLIKGTGILAAGAVGLVAFVLLIVNFKNNSKIRWSYVFWVGVMAAVSLLKLLSKYFIGDAHVSAGMIGVLNGLPSLMHIRSVRWFLISLAIYIIAILIKRRYTLKEFFSSGIMYVYGSMFFILLLNFFAVSPRYKLSVYPFLVFGIIYSLSLIIRQRVFLKTVTIVLILLMASFSYSRSGVKDHVVLEESLEYRNDLRVDQAVAKSVETRYASFRIVAPMQIAQMLALTELGYVERDIDVTIYGFSCHYGGIKNYPGLDNLNIRNTIFIGKESDRDQRNLIPGYPIDPTDIVLEELYSGNKKAWIFSGGQGIEKLFRVIQQIRTKKN